jgi:hypothetical protein
MANLQSTPIRTYDTLPSFYKSFLVSYYVSYLNNIASYGVVQDFNGLVNSDASCKELNHISSLQNDVRVIGFPGCPDRHGTIDEIQRTRYTLELKHTGY